MIGFFAGIAVFVAALLSMPIANDAITRIFKRADGSSMGFRPKGKQSFIDPIFLGKVQPMFGVDWDSRAAQNQMMYDILVGRCMKEARFWMWLYFCAPMLGALGFYLAFLLGGLL